MWRSVCQHLVKMLLPGPGALGPGPWCGQAPFLIPFVSQLAQVVTFCFAVTDPEHVLGL